MTVFDISGFSKRLPKEDKIQSVQLSDATFRVGYDISSYCDNLLLKNKERKPVMSDDANVISAMYELEKYIVENKRYEHEATVYDISSVHEGENIKYGVENISFLYKMKNGTSFSRRYFVKLDDATVDLLNRVVCTDDWKSYYTLSDKLDLSGFDSAMLSIYSDNYKDYEENGEDSFSISRKQLEKLIAAKDADISGRSYMDILKRINLSGNTRVYDVNITVSILKKDIKEKTGMSIYESGSLSFTVMSLDKNTLACLHEIGVI